MDANKNNLKKLTNPAKFKNMKGYIKPTPHKADLKALNGAQIDHRVIHGTPQYKKPAVSPGIINGSFPIRDDVRMHTYASPIRPYTSPYTYGGEWPVREQSMYVNPLERVNSVISGLEHSQSPKGAKGNEVVHYQHGQGSEKSSSVQTANFECNDAEYIGLFEHVDDSSSIHSALAMEVSSEFVKNDYLSLR